MAKIDVVIEVLDARLPGASSNPMIEELRLHRQRPRLKILNKSDLADPSDHMELIDTPGLMWRAIQYPSDGLMLAASHALGENACIGERDRSHRETTGVSRQRRRA